MHGGQVRPNIPTALFATLSVSLIQSLGAGRGITIEVVEIP